MLKYAQGGAKVLKHGNVLLVLAYFFLSFRSLVIIGMLKKVSISWGFSLVLLLLASSGCNSSGGGGTSEDNFPTRPITMLVPWAPGGMTDLSSRALAAVLQKHIGTSVNVINRTG
jgi:hypothetical protein